MNTREHTAMKMRGNPDISYLGHTVDQMIWSFMEQEKIDGLTLAIVQAPYIPRVAGYGYSDSQRRRLASPNTMWPAGPISQAFAAVAVMQLHEDGGLDVNRSCEPFAIICCLSVMTSPFFSFCAMHRDCRITAGRLNSARTHRGHLMPCSNWLPGIPCTLFLVQMWSRALPISCC